MSARHIPDPPALFRVLLLGIAGDSHGGLAAGDLHEEFLLFCEEHGRGAGRRWYASQVVRSLPQLLALRVRSGEFTRLLLAMSFAAAPLVLIDRLWCLVYSHIPLKDGLDRAPGFLAVNLLVLWMAAMFCGGLARSRRSAAAVATASAGGAAIGLWLSLGALPIAYLCVVILAAPAGCLVGFWKWRSL